MKLVSHPEAVRNTHRDRPESALAAKNLTRRRLLRDTAKGDGVKH
jgi:hypothetical protein